MSELDENYLDSLLNEITLDNEIDEDKVETELDTELEKEQENEEKEKNSIEHMVEEDARQEVLNEDSHIPMEELDELDELDNIADLDMEHLDFDDIDFNDIDITNIDASLKNTKLPELEDIDNIDISDFFEEESAEESTEEEELLGDVEDDLLYQFEEEAKEEIGETSEATKEDSIEDDIANSKEETYEEWYEGSGEENTDNIENTENTENTEKNTFLDDNELEDYNIQEDAENVSGEEDDIEKTNNELDDLFSMLGIEDEDNDNQEDSLDNIPVVDEMEPDSILAELESIEKTPPKKTKRTLSQIIFGDPDEDEEEGISSEELEAKKAEKEAKKAEKKAKKEEEKAKKNEAKLAKEATSKVKNDKKLQEKEAKKKSLEQEALNAVPDKKISKVMVALLAIVGVAIVGVLVIGTNTFNYNLIIKKASDYFNRQKYHQAYDQVAGVDVKEKDQELKDRIYTVMYVERLYESYENNMNMGYPDKALDSLLRGLIKYDERYNDAVELGITSDIDGSRDKIVAALTADFGITLEEAQAINQLEGYDYISAINSYSQNVEGGSDTTATEGSTEDTTTGN